MNARETAVLNQAPSKSEEPRSERRPAVETAAITEPRYRNQAMASYENGQLLNATGLRLWAWLGIPLLIAAAMAIVAVVSQVEIVSASPARVRLLGGPRSIRVPIDSYVAQLPAKSGDNVDLGQALVVLRTTSPEDQIVLTAPVDGVLETLALDVGERVEAGAIAATVIPAERPVEVLSTIAERDRPFLELGQQVRLQLGQLPEAGATNLRATITRLSTDLAAPSALLDTFGAGTTEASYFVWLSLVPDERYRSVSRYVRPGMLMEAKYTLRTRRFANWVLDPLGKWLP